MSSTDRILITGAAGLVGGILRAHWAESFPLRLADIRPAADLRPHEEFTLFDMTDSDDCRRVCQDIHTVVHLAADPSSEEFEKSLLPLNIIGPYNMLEAAAASACRRFIFTSSIYAVRGHGADPPVAPSQPVCPQGLYGASKCWGEALTRTYADSRDLSCIVVRLGNPRFDQAGDWNADDPSYMISPRDTAQLFARCVEVPDVDFAIVHASSLHRHMWLDIKGTRELLGFEPEDGTAFPRGEVEV